MGVSSYPRINSSALETLLQEMGGMNHFDWLTNNTDILTFYSSWKLGLGKLISVVLLFLKTF